ncbi:unnamed protein product [Rotaria magnacalcarata]|uniref:Uncharacterized protein n=1 Tax=Rotaria magnacalcarata TaxID=392030 RepID=A0A815PTW1_9BILA|nr:unnamed protein product [Rotaria magnacalcarata]CAF3847299.1 unnamed protein product [Rotaria magnacalcarata]
MDDAILDQVVQIGVVRFTIIPKPNVSHMEFRACLQGGIEQIRDKTTVVVLDPREPQQLGMEILGGGPGGRNGFAQVEFEEMVRRNPSFQMFADGFRRHQQQAVAARNEANKPD